MSRQKETFRKSLEAEANEPAVLKRSVKMRSCSESFYHSRSCEAVSLLLFIVLFAKVGANLQPSQSPGRSTVEPTVQSGLQSVRAPSFASRSEDSDTLTLTFGVLEGDSIELDEKVEIAHPGVKTWFANILRQSIGQCLPLNVISVGQPSSRSLELKHAGTPVDESVQRLEGAHSNSAQGLTNMTVHSLVPSSHNTSEAFKSNHSRGVANITVHTLGNSSPNTSQHLPTSSAPNQTEDNVSKITQDLDKPNEVRFVPISSDVSAVAQNQTSAQEAIPAQNHTSGWSFLATLPRPFTYFLGSPGRRLQLAPDAAVEKEMSWKQEELFRLNRRVEELEQRREAATAVCREAEARARNASAVLRSLHPEVRLYAEQSARKLEEEQEKSERLEAELAQLGEEFCRAEASLHAARAQAKEAAQATERKVRGELQGEVERLEAKVRGLTAERDKAREEGTRWLAALTEQQKAHEDAQEGHTAEEAALRGELAALRRLTASRAAQIEEVLNATRLAWSTVRILKK